jgi:hypothetical protein
MWHSGGALQRPDCFPDGKDELTVFTILVQLRINRDECITNDQLQSLKFLARKFYIKQSTAIDSLDIDGYRCDNPDLARTGNRPNLIDPQTTRLTAALLHKLCPGGTRTKDGLFFIPPPLPTTYHKIAQLSDWTSTTVQCTGEQPSKEEVMKALIERRSTIGQYVQFAAVPPELIDFLYTHEGCRGRVTLKENVLMMCTKEGGEIIIARNTGGIVELQTKRGNAKGEFHAPKAIFSSNVRRGGGVHGQSVLRVVYFTFSNHMMNWLDKMYTDHMIQDKTDTRHCKHV